MHLEFKVHGHNPELLDASGENIFVPDDPLNQSINYRPSVYPNTLYLFTEEMRQGIVEDYKLDPLADQLLAIDGNSTYSHDDSTMSELWLESTNIIPRGRGT